MSKFTTRSIESTGHESIGSQRPRLSEAHGENSATIQASDFDLGNYDTALPPIQFQQVPLAHRRTGSTLKTVMRKIFNRKRQSQTDGLEESPHEPYYATLPARQSGPTVGKSFLAIPTPSGSKRSSPLSEENLQLSETHLSPTSLTAGSLPSSGPNRRRRATLPSVIFSDDESQYAVASTAISDPQEDRSCTPDQQLRRDLLQDRRRSRSTHALRSLAKDRPMSPTAWRPRTASIPTSAPDSKSPPLEESSASGHSGRRSTGTTVTSVTRASAAPSTADSDPHAEQMSLPPNVGNLVRTMQQDDGLTVGQRLNTLEVKMIDLEFAIARMQSNPIGDGPPTRSSRPKQGPSPDSVTSRTRNKPSSGFLASVDSDESPSPLTNLPAGRPTSTSTIRPETMSSRSLRPAASASSLAADFGGVSIEQYSTLVTLLRREQTARRNLESQVSGLRDDLRQIQQAALRSMETGTMYPIHSVDSGEFLRHRRGLDDSETSSPIRTTEDRPNGRSDEDCDWDRHDQYARDDPFGPSKWENGQRIVPAPMI